MTTSSSFGKTTTFCIFLTLILAGCDELAQRRKEQPRTEQVSSAAVQKVTPAPNEAMRFVFPSSSSPFPNASVALDTTTGRLCKTYAWEDNPRLPKGLHLCSESLVPTSFLTGAAKAYLGFTYTFNGTKWVKGSKATRFNDKLEEELWSDDQYDPLNLFSKQEKAKRTLTVAEIQKVADQFGVSYQEAAEEAKQHGYQVPSKH